MHKSIVSQHISLPPVSENLGIVCTQIGCVSVSPSNPKEQQESVFRSPFHGNSLTLDYWLLVYMLSGDVSLSLNGTRNQFVHQGNVAVIPANTEFTIGLDPGSYVCAYYVGFKGKSLDERKVCTAIDELVPITEVGLSIELVEFFQSLLETGRYYTEGTQRELGASIVLLVAKIVNRKHELQIIHPKITMIDQAKALMHYHVHDHISIEDIARAIHLPVSTFRRMFKQIVGLSPYQYLLTCKIDVAKKELLKADVPQRIIAEHLGFTDQYHFSRVFKHITGQRPSEWRFEHSLS
jgi:AraC-like DNA-binding protein